MIFKVILGGLVVTVITLIVFQAIDPNLNTNNKDPSNTNNIGKVESYSYGISGAINRSGTYTLSENATMADLLEAAGDVKTDADDRCYFLDAQLVNNQTYYIPQKYFLDDVCGTQPIEKVNINSASIEELDTLDNVGEQIAKKIIEYRESDGRFDTLEEIMNVSGIKNGFFAKIKDKITLK